MNYHNITTEDMNNGDGLRTVLWVAGCAHHCKECQNPQTWDENGGIPFDDVAFDELMDKLSKDYISGITFSGGDPLFPSNRDVITNIIQKIKQKFGNTKTIWIYTGYDWEDIKDLSMVQMANVIVDGKFEVSKKDISLKWKGSSNQRVIDVQATLNSENPLIPILHTRDDVEFNDTEIQYFASQKASCCD